MFQVRGVPMREIHGLPYAVHQVGEGQWQIVIENCPRYPSGYRFHRIYHSQQEALQSLASWPGHREDPRVAGDDTGVVAWLAEETARPETSHAGDEPS
ncbi:hypothetical protein [Alicyclobacillus shizuokensis]|uniref:hypothetical protein n=1 Tax=Alicyclobacillus shizuokensis TaxID=392014 RepID=UPI00082CC3EA|nr:hypothetical protein [Alicyclobacillus shizuokensis]MCL6625467.1 hypothetical protein [Alicyclobacillus shizuokensis]